MNEAALYTERRVAESQTVRVRDLDMHVWRWEPPGPAAHTLVALHGWMDLGASFQFLVDHLPADWRILAPDWRGFGRSAQTSSDSYWFYDYLGDLDSLLDQLVADEPVNLLGHSMGGNVVMLYAGVRPARIRRLINLEGAGMPPSDPTRAPDRLAKWLDALQTGARLRDYDSVAAVAERLMKTNQRLRPDRAHWLAQRWSRVNAQGQYQLLADPRHKIINPYLYRADEVDACWAAIEAPVLWIDAEHQSDRLAFTKTDAYQARQALVRRLSRHVLADAGHMLHHDQPEALAELVRGFIDAEQA